MSGFLSGWQPELPSVVLMGARVVVRPPQMGDWREWIAVRSRNETHLRPFEPLWPDHCLTRDFFKQRLKRQQWDWEHHLARYFLIRLKDGGPLIGGVNINNLHLGAARHGSLGYWIDQDHQGQGLMREALQLVLRYGFEDLQLQRIHAACLPDNPRSMGLLQRIGLKEEGFAKAYLQINGHWRDHHLFGLTRADYACPESLDRLAGSIPRVA